MELHGCSVGQGEPGRQLAIALAQLWNVRVAAGTVLQNTNAGFETAYIVAHPNGRIEQREGNHVLTPEEIRYLTAAALVLWLPLGIGMLGAAVAATIDEGR